MERTELNFNNNLIIAGKTDAIEEFLSKNNQEAIWLPPEKSHYTEYAEIAANAKGNVCSQNSEFLDYLLKARENTSCQVVTCRKGEQGLMTRVLNVKTVIENKKVMSIDIR